MELPPMDIGLIGVVAMVVMIFLGVRVVYAAALTGLRWCDPLVLHGAHRADEAALQAFEDRFAVGLDRLSGDPRGD